MVKLESLKETKSIILEPGFGFCIGKRKMFTKISLSSFDRASDRFDGEERMTSEAHALFFGCDTGDEGIWLGELNSQDLAPEWRIERNPPKKIDDTRRNSERTWRLGLANKNPKQNWIRIAPMKNSNIKSGVLEERIPEVERWVKNTLGQANIGSVPDKFLVVPAKESPILGDPFDVLWVNYEFDDMH